MTEPEKILFNYTANPLPLSPLAFKVPVEYAGMRLDQALAKLLPEYSRSRLQDWIAQGLVKADGAAATIKQKMWGGEAIEVTPLPHPAEQPHQAEDIALDIVFEDDSILVINKPAGLVVHPGSGNWKGTLLNALLHHAPQLGKIPRAGIVHRLDKDTSGLLVVAKTLTAQTALVRQLQARTVKREYLALAYGEVERAGMVNAPMGRHPTQRTKMAIVEDGKSATTHYSVAERFPACTLLRCKLETGRTHQIRVHLASIRHPLVGDNIYIKGAQKCVQPPRHGGAKHSGAGGAARRLLPQSAGSAITSDLASVISSPSRMASSSTSNAPARGRPVGAPLLPCSSDPSSLSQPQLRAILAAFPRQALHAAQLGLEHPVTGEWLEWQAPLPDDMAQLLVQIRSASHEPA